MYYPLSQITSNLHTNGGEFVIKNTNTPYVGYYWKTSKGQYFTGKTPQDTPTEELISYSPEATTIPGINVNNSSKTAVSFYNSNELSALLA